MEPFSYGGRTDAPWTTCFFPQTSLRVVRRAGMMPFVSPRTNLRFDCNADPFEMQRYKFAKHV